MRKTISKCLYRCYQRLPWVGINNLKYNLIMKIRCVFYATIAALLIISCGDSKQVKGLTEGASGDMEAYENSDVNAIEQARPSIMVIPGDQTLKNFKCQRLKM